MERADSLADFLANPMGRYFRGRRHGAFAHSPTLLGFFSWGRPGVDDIRELLEACAFGLRPGMSPYRWLVDLRSLELIDPATFDQFVQYTRKHGEVLRRNIVRQAQLRPDGLVGAILTGFSHIARLSYPDRVFGDVDEALAWLAVDRDVGLSLLAELEAIRSAACGSFDVVARLREELRGAGPLAIDDAARRLAVSIRSLQRVLQEAGTTYRLELKAYRIRRAQELLKDSEQSLASIASEVGFSSSQHFATAYRRAIGDAPGAWRARHRGSE